jgi:cytochrome c oxidase cbb3-type subunit 3
MAKELLKAFKIARFVVPCYCLSAYVLMVNAQQASGADSARKGPQEPASEGRPEEPNGKSTPVQLHGHFLDVPVSTFVPGGGVVAPDIHNPVASDAAAPQRGMKYFSAFNCVGCHMGNGGGGMGPALSRKPFIYGSHPANIYMTIVQGRPNGMPAWGSLLPDEIVLDLVAYIQSLSDEPKAPEWGTTVSTTTPMIEQVPAELQTTAKPWDFTEKAKSGQQP